MPFKFRNALSLMKALVEKTHDECEQLLFYVMTMSEHQKHRRFLFDIPGGRRDRRHALVCSNQRLPELLDTAYPLTARQDELHWRRRRPINLSGNTHDARS